MAASSIAHRWKYDVFVSFRGEDIRKTFMDHLFNDFKHKGINAFKDDRELPKGEEISPHLYKAIEESRFLIVIFSKNYASSSWCLRELVKILECKHNKNPKYEVRIIFYDVKPDVVRKQTGSYAEAFAKHQWVGFTLFQLPWTLFELVWRKPGLPKKKINKEEVDQWKVALSMAANLVGWDLHDKTNGYESTFINIISKDILKRLCDGPLHVGENLVGVDFHSEKLNMLRFVGSDKVNMIGICGISGIGKTTLAKAIYNLMYVHFEGSCFCEDVQEVTKRQGLIQVQMYMINKIMKIKDLEISSVGEGIMVIKQRVACKPILLVLDGVDNHEQLEALASSRDWFFPGSLIIFTGKDKQLLRPHGVDEIHDMAFLNENISLELFSSYAFKEKHPTRGFNELADKIVKYVQGHPLALKVLGRFLYGKNVGHWESELEMLKVHPNEQIQQVLRLSYDGLNTHQQNILLDIACSFLEVNSDFAASVLDGCNFYAHTNMKVLVDKSLITISSDMSLQMHDLIKAMAREIVREKSVMPRKQRRLWISSEVYDLLSENKVTLTKAAEILVLLLEKSSQKVHIDATEFAHAKRLRILKIYQVEEPAQKFKLKDYNVYFSGSFDFLSSKLRLFCWHGCPFEYLPSNFYPENIVAIDLSYSNIKQLWTTPKCLRRLKVMKLRYCCSLTTTPDFTGITNLEELSLEGCVNLDTFHPSIGMLKRLVVINMRDCKHLKTFPSNLKMEKLPEDSGRIKILVELHINGTPITERPENLHDGPLHVGENLARWWKYDVFVSFRGEDIRKVFMDHMFNDFKQKGIHAFRDDRELPKGEEISSHLYKAIEESRCLIVMFSRNYASSPWCLRELVKILECKQMGKPKYEVQIIFYDVKPHVVRTQTESYAEAFARHQALNRPEVNNWKEALSMAANLSGWDLWDMKNGFEYKFIHTISKGILNTLFDGTLHVGDNLVGIDFHLDRLDLSRFVGSDTVNMIGICGISGIGKTTLAKAIYNLIHVNFERRCFCEDVQGVSKRQGITKVQMQIIEKILKIEDPKISNVGEGAMVIKQRISRKLILLVLDDVNDVEQLEALAGSPDWFFPGSLIVFTSKNEQLLSSHIGGSNFYETNTE